MTQHILTRKNEQTETLNSFLVSCCIPDMFIRGVGFSLSLLLNPPPKKIGARKLSSPYIFVAGVQWFLPHNVSPLTPQNESPPLFFLLSAEGISSSADSIHAYEILGPRVFFTHPKLTQSFPRDKLTHNCLS